MNDANVEAPIKSPAAANTVLGLLPRSCLTAPARTAAPAVGAVVSFSSRPWKSLVPRIWMSLVVGSAVSIPTISGLWSEERNGPEL
jgi:hypothetical protein